MSLLSVGDYSGETIAQLLEDAAAVKASPEAFRERLDGLSVALVFEKPSTRTRVSMELAVKQLGGDCVVLHASELQLGRGETVEDTARVLSRYVDCVAARVVSHRFLTDFSAASSVPVVNTLSDVEHPCQALADVFTVHEHFGDLTGPLAYVGDGNNVAASLVLAAERAGMPVRLACPRECRLPQSILKQTPGAVSFEDSADAVVGARVVYTDTWVSMGDEGEEAQRMSLLSPYRVDEALMAAAADDAVFMHCLPAHRGHEVTDAVLDGPQSIVWRQAENRLHMQKAILLHELGAR